MLLTFIAGVVGVVTLQYGGSLGSPYVVSIVSFLVSLFLLRRFVPQRKERAEGSIFITGCDTGMGETTAIYLAGKGFRVFAGVYLRESFQKLKDQTKEKYGTDVNIIPVSIDVTNQESIQKAFDTVKEELRGKQIGLVAIINCAGVATIGPAEYMPIADFRRQLEVNLIGYVATTQAFFPLLRQTVDKPNARRGRIIFVGTGGGVPAPSPPLLSAYMASKWGVEAYCQSLRLEMKLAKRRIDCCMINPGFTKPTGLYAIGKTYAEKSWSLMPAQAKEEYSKFVDAFIDFGMSQPGTHVSEVAFTIEKALTVGEPSLRYCVGFDSKVSPIVGLLPTKWKEYLILSSMFSKVRN